jgi:TolB-like protein
LAYSGIEDMPSGEQSPWNSHLAASNGERLTRRLDSWKEIASHFNRSEKTVRRWEENEGLPIHRLLHEKRGSVYAYTDELEGWWESRQSHNSVRAGPLNQELHQPELEAAFAGTAESDAETFVQTLDETPETDGAGTEERNRGSPVPPQRRQVIFIICGLLPIVGIIVVHAFGRFRSAAVQRSSSVKIRSLAVLPFENLSGDTDQEYFADGMTAELITEVAKISSIRVISRTSVMRYKRLRKPLADIARELNVDAVVEGEVLRSQDLVRVTAQLIDASTDRHLWSETYDRDLRDVVSLQADVAQSIARAIGARVTPAEDSHRASTRRVDPEAYEAYLRGRFFYQKRTTAGFNKAADYFLYAVRIDPRFGRSVCRPRKDIRHPWYLWDTPPERVLSEGDRGCGQGPTVGRYSFGGIYSARNSPDNVCARLERRRAGLSAGY